MAPMIIEGFKMRRLQPGPSIELKCEASGEPMPEISWYLDGRRILATDEGNTGVEHRITDAGMIESALTVFKVRPEDGGMYSCKASNRLSTVSHHARLQTYGLPVVRSMGNLSVVAQHNLTVICPVYGYPIHQISWYKGQCFSFCSVWVLVL